MKKSLLSILAVLVMLFTGCNKTPDGGNGRLIIKVTDAPFPVNFIESATVTITKVEIRKAGDGISDSNPFSVIWEGSSEFNLLELRNGLVAKLLDLEIPSGEYDLIRLYVDEAGLKVKDGESYSVKVPSGQQTGIKLFIDPGLIVEGGLTEELLLDFDLSNSFVIQGNTDSPAGIKGFIFKPVLRAVNNSTTGSIMGLVTDKDNAVIAGASIKLKQGGVEVENVNAITEADGTYEIMGLVPGTYSVEASKDLYNSVTIDDKKVVAGNKTEVNFVLPLK
jgi:uncharacterized surface anchored protein